MATDGKQEEVATTTMIIIWSWGSRGNKSHDRVAQSPIKVRRCIASRRRNSYGSYLIKRQIAGYIILSRSQVDTPGNEDRVIYWIKVRIKRSYEFQRCHDGSTRKSQSELCQIENRKCNVQQRIKCKPLSLDHSWNNCDLQWVIIGCWHVLWFHHSGAAEKKTSLPTLS